MGLFSWLFSTGTSKVVEAVGTAVNKNIKTWRGDKAEVEAAIADEQLATLASHASEFAERGTRTRLDSVIDFINRLPRPLIVFWALSFLIIPYFAPAAFLEYVLSLQMIPDELWTLILAVFSFFLGSRIISQDIRKPRLTEEEKKAGIEIIREREKVILENRTPLVVEKPTKKPPPPPWANPISKPAPLEPAPPINPTPPVFKGRPVDIDKMVDDLIKREGGYVNDPADSGGPTKYGITHITLSDWRGVKCGEDEVMALGEDEAADIYRAIYYFAPGIDSIPMALQTHVFDIAVNSGQRGAIRMLQQALNKLGAGIKEDGVMGPMTRDACSDYDSKRINNTLVDLRVKFYQDLAARRPKDQRFLAGWLKRANGFRAA